MPLKADWWVWLGAFWFGFLFIMDVTCWFVRGMSGKYWERLSFLIFNRCNEINVLPLREEKTIYISIDVLCYKIMCPSCVQRIKKMLVLKLQSYVCGFATPVMMAVGVWPSHICVLRQNRLIMSSEWSYRKDLLKILVDYFLLVPVFLFLFRFRSLVSTGLGPKSSELKVYLYGAC